MLRNVFVIFLFPLLVYACTSVDRTGRYRVQSIGNAQRSVRAEVVSAEPAYILEETSGAGSALGATVGGGLAADTSDNVAVIIAGVILGRVVGEYIEAQGNVHNATEYIIETENGVLLTVAQIDSGNMIFESGSKVVLVYGYPNRLLLDPQN